MTFQAPLFSVLIANYNNGAYITEALESVYKQTYDNWEIIIVDDCSTDNSEAIYKELVSNPKIKIYRNDANKGAGYTKKRCIDLAQGQVCGFLDPDDALDSNAISVMIENHNKNPNVGLIHSRHFVCDDKLNVVNESNRCNFDLQQNNSYFFNLESYITHFSTFKKSYYEQTTGINPYLQRAVDQDLYLKLFEVCQTKYLDIVLYYYRIHNRGISTIENVDKAYYWHWVVIIHAGERRNINLESLFTQNFVMKVKYEKLKNQYSKLQKYERLNYYLSRIKKILFRL